MFGLIMIHAEADRGATPIWATSVALWRTLRPLVEEVNVAISLLTKDSISDLEVRRMTIGAALAALEQRPDPDGIRGALLRTMRRATKKYGRLTDFGCRSSTGCFSRHDAGYSPDSLTISLPSWFFGHDEKEIFGPEAKVRHVDDPERLPEPMDDAGRAVVDVIDAIDSLGCYPQATIDVDSAHMLNDGTQYGSIRNFGNPTWRTGYEHAAWYSYGQGAPYKRVRWPAWGTYLGPELAKRADPDGSLLEQVLLLRKYRAPGGFDIDCYSAWGGCIVKRYASGGLLLCTSRRPWDAYMQLPEAPYDEVTVRMMFLRDVFIARGLM